MSERFFDQHGRVRFVGDLEGAGGYGYQVTAVSFDAVDVPVVAAAVPGEGLELYTPAIGEVFLWQFSGFSIAPGDEFDGDYTLDVYVEGQQGVGSIGGVNPGDVNAVADPAINSTNGLWQLAAFFGPLGGNPAPARWVDTRYIFGTVDPIVVVFEGGTTPPTVGRVTFLLATIRPA